MAFAHEIGAIVIAEGIETRGELETLQALGVPWGQGFHVAAAPPAAEPGPCPARGAGLARGRLTTAVAQPGAAAPGSTESSYSSADTSSSQSVVPSEIAVWVM